MHTLAIAMLSFLVVATAKADDRGEVASLLRFCESAEPAKENVCLGYIAGFVDAHHMATGYVELSEDGTVTGQGWRNRAFCVPNDWTPFRGRDAYVRWAKDNPESWGVGAGAALTMALVTAFPCGPLSREGGNDQ